VKALVGLFLFIEQEGGRMKNESGIYPVEYKVLVLLDKVEEKTEGGIYFPEQTREREEWASQRGTLIAIGGNAFEDVKEPIPKPGDRICTVRYPGGSVTGKDGKKYHLINDKEMTAIIREE